MQRLEERRGPCLDIASQSPDDIFAFTRCYSPDCLRNLQSRFDKRVRVAENSGQPKPTTLNNADEESLEQCALRKEIKSLERQKRRGEF